MGMFDTVYVRCECGDRAEIQSKAGECQLYDYQAQEGVPTEIARDIRGQTARCRGCGAEYEMRVFHPVGIEFMEGRKL